MLLFNDALEDSVWEMFQFTPTNPSENQIPKSEQKVRISTPFFFLLSSFSLNNVSLIRFFFLILDSLKNSAHDWIGVNWNAFSVIYYEAIFVVEICNFIMCEIDFYRMMWVKIHITVKLHWQGTMHFVTKCTTSNALPAKKVHSHSLRRMHAK